MVKKPKVRFKFGSDGSTKRDYVEVFIDGDYEFIWWGSGLPSRADRADLCRKFDAISAAWIAKRKRPSRKVGAKKRGV